MRLMNLSLYCEAEDYSVKFMRTFNIWKKDDLSTFLTIILFMDDY